MTEPLENILSDGYKIWRKNLNLALPFVFDMIVNCILFAMIILILYATIFPTLMQFFQLSSVNWNKAVVGLIMEIFFSAFFIILPFAIIYGVTSSFFSAGAIGMAKEVIGKGNTSLSEMVNYGKKKFISLFILKIILAILIIVALILFIIPAFVGFDIFSIYVLAISILFAPVPYAIVVSNLGLIDGLKKGFNFVKENTLTTILLVFVREYLEMALVAGVFFFSFIAFLIIMLFTLPSSLSIGTIMSNAIAILSSLSIGVIITIFVFVVLYLAFSTIVVLPLITLWWTKLYVDRTDKKEAIDTYLKK